MLSIDPTTIATSRLHNYLLHAVAPRPIAFASTVDAKGNPNLSPFSFFNVFSANPPVMIFSPSRRMRDNTTKHTLENAQETREVVINVVNYELVQQMSLASTEYPKGVNEFIKSGLTMMPSDLVKPYRVAESPVQFECRVNDIIALGTGGGAGNLIICEVVRFHLSEAILDADKNIDPYKIDLVSRMGGDWYCRSRLGMFEMPKPVSNLGIGVDGIPREIRESDILTGNDLGRLGTINLLLSKEEAAAFIAQTPQLQNLLDTADMQKIHKKAQEYIENNDIATAWKLLLASIS